jgi:hypothetical protein
MVEYEVLIKEDRGTFFTDISNKYLSDLDFSDLDHYVDATEVIDSFDNTLANGFKYVMPFNIDTQYQLNWFKPAIYAQTYFDRIFATSGYSYTWDGLADANFDKLLIPYNGDQNVVDWNDAKVVAENSGWSHTWATPQVNASISQMTTPVRYPITTAWTETLDTANIFNTTNGQYTTPQWTGVGAGQSYTWEMTVSYTLSLDASTSCFSLGPIILPQYPHSNSFRLALNISIDGNQNTDCIGQYIYADYDTTALPAGTTSLGSFTEVFTLTATSDGAGGIDYNDIQIAQARILLGAGQYRMWEDEFSTIPFTAPDVILDITSIDLTIRPSDNIPLNSGITTMNTFIPEKIKQSDFIKSIFMMYNLYATSDPNNENNLILLHRDEYYDSGKAVDWTNLLMKDKDQSIVFIPELSNKKLRLSYKADTDSPNTVYTDVTREIYGQVEVTFDNEYVKEIDVKELLFSPTPVQPTVFGAFLPLLNGAAPKTNLRILYDNGQVTAQPIDILSGYDTVTSTGGVYPYLSHFGGADPFNPIFDINFAECQYYYYQVIQNTNNNLYNKYWRRTVAQINGGKLLTAYFYLRETDIQYMELNDKIRIDNSWWSINKIIDYNANDSSPTKVELISLETEIDLPPFFSGTITPVGPGNGTQIQSIMNTYRSTTNVTTNNNDSIIIGSGNVVGDGLRALVVGDGLSIENDGIATTNLTVTQTLNGRAVSDILPTYKKYIALITQSSTAAPTVVELENTIGPIIWTRTAVGEYEGTLTGAFTNGKTYVTLSQVYKNSMAVAYRKTDDIIEIETTNFHSPTAAHHDTHLSNNTLEIRVYE